MVLEEAVTGMSGYSGVIQIGVAKPMCKGPRWSVEIFHKARLKVPSRRQARELLAVHGADRVEVSYRVRAVWPTGIDPPWLRCLPPTESPNDKPKTLHGHLAALAAARAAGRPRTAFAKPWFAAFNRA